MIITEKKLVCDKCNKTLYAPKSWSAAMLRKNAKSEGWRQWNAKDKCPDCCRVMTHPVNKLCAKTGSIVSRYENMTTAALESNTHRSKILRAIKTGILASGYKWESA